MRLSRDGVPVVILSHRKREFLPQAVQSLRAKAVGVTDVIVVDDSGDEAHHQWLDNHGYQYSVVDPRHNAGYLRAMNQVWCAARHAADEAGVDYVLLWEEDFIATRTFSTYQMRTVMDAHPALAHLNLQRQAVYKVEKRLGYMNSHARRGYDLRRTITQDIPWVARRTPFTTNPGLIRREVLDFDWPNRAECDTVEGGAEPAMGAQLEFNGYHFGWLGHWDTPYTRHIGDDRKTGTGY